MGVQKNIGFPNGDARNATGVFRGHAFRKGAANALAALNVKFKQRFGYDIPVLEGMRSVEKQEFYWNRYVKKLPGWTVAAVPRTSNHGWGLSGDLAPPLDDRDSEEHEWMRDNAPDFGWDWDGVEFDEDWHWTWLGRKLSAAQIAAWENSTPATKPESIFVTSEGVFLVFVDGFGHYVITSSYVSRVKVATVTALKKLPGIRETVLPFAEFYEIWADINAGNKEDSQIASVRDIGKLS